ncbi:MAG TPA: GNAT family N-acetyltransferase [Acidimicrobiales bacterium]
MHIRPRRTDDVDALLEMAQLVKAVDGYPPRGPIDLASFLAPPQQLAAWVAEHDDNVVGHVALHGAGAAVTTAVAARHTQKQPDELAVVARVLVSPTARRQGVGHALLDTAVAEAQGRGLHPFLDVATELRAAITLYESYGWDWAGEVTIHLDDEPSLQCFVYVAPPVAVRRQPEVTRR